VKERASCFSSCFATSRKEDPANLMSIDHKHFFPREFLKAVTTRDSRKKKYLERNSVSSSDQKAKRPEG